MFGKHFFENLLGKKEREELVITRADSPKIIKERKSRDFDTSAIRSPRTTRRGRSSHNLNHHDVFDSTASSIDRYQIDNVDFAKGAYGKVSIATDKISKEKVVIKQIPKTTPIRMVQNEIRAGQLLGEHPDIALFHQYLEFVDHHALVFSFIDGQDLFSYLEKSGFAPRAETQAREIATSILRAIEHTHTKSIAHRDIKLENILLDKSGKAFVIDYGLCAFVEEGKKLREWCGSDNYLAPQIVRRQPYDGYKADVFSIGVVLFAMVFGVFPFDNLRVNGRYSNDPSRPLPKLRVRFPADVKVNPSVKELLLMMLEDDEDKRISVPDILKHEWIVGESAESLSLSKKSNE